MRTRPYTRAGLARVPCAHCGEPSAHQWNLTACAIGKGGWFGVCTPCDIELNRMVLRFLRHPDAEKLIATYGATRA